MKTLRGYLLVLAATWGLIMLPTQAMAYELLVCDTGGDVEEGTQLFYTGDNNDVGFCQYQGLEHIFSQIACDFTIILNEVLGKIYCGIQYNLKPVLAILLTLYVMVFGVQLLMGTAQLTVKESIVRLIKVAAVWVFATEALWGIGLIFAFFLDFANQGLYWALRMIVEYNPVTDPITGDTGPIMDMPLTPQGGISDAMPAYAYIDQLIYAVVLGPFTTANSKLLGFFAVMAYIIPPLFLIAVYWLWTTFKLLVRALISFLMGISALAFLIALSPIFLSFMLFMATRMFFENWLKYLISYTLQIVIVFAVVAMWAIAIHQFVGFFNTLAETIFPYNKVWVPGAALVDPTDSWGICPYQMTTTPIGPTIACVDPGFNPVNNPDDHKAIIALPNINQEENAGAQTALNELIYFVIYHLITLTVICYAFDALLKKAPDVARQLAGPQYVPILGQGWGNVGFSRVRGGPGSGQQVYHRFSEEGRDQRAINPVAIDATSNIGRGFIENTNKQVSTRK